MGYSNPIVGSYALQSVANEYFNDVNYISTFVEPTTSNNIITNDTILTQYSIKQGIKVFGKSKGCSMKRFAAVPRIQSC